MRSILYLSMLNFSISWYSISCSNLGLHFPSPSVIFSTIKVAVSLLGVHRRDLLFFFFFLWYVLRQYIQICINFYEVFWIGMPVEIYDFNFYKLNFYDLIFSPCLAACWDLCEYNFYPFILWFYFVLIVRYPFYIYLIEHISIIQ